MTNAPSGVAPTALPANQPPERFYIGGAKIAEFRSLGTAEPSTPEDWIASTTTLHGEPSLGLSMLPNGQHLRDAIVADPASWLGLDHVDAFGADTMLLVKLLDAGQRLPVHIHPDSEFASSNFGAAHGKTEAWHILEGGEVFLGFSRPVSMDELRSWVNSQDVDSMLAAMHRIEVQPGDFVFVPAGLPHAIGADIFLIEVQEPEDFSILLEWDGFAIDGPGKGHLGLGFDAALTATDITAWSRDDIEELTVRAEEGTELPRTADSFFRAELLHIDSRETLEASFGVLVCIEGSAALTSESGSAALMSRGSTFVIPHASGPVTLDGHASVLLCRPPLPRR